jgi:hypothetical protein
MVLLAVLLSITLVLAVPLMMVNVALSESIVQKAVEGVNLSEEFSTMLLKQLDQEGAEDEQRFVLLLILELNPGAYVEEAVAANIVPLLRYLKGQGDFPELAVDLTPLKDSLLERLADPGELLRVIESKYPQEYQELQGLLSDPQVLEEIFNQLQVTLEEEFPQRLSLLEVTEDEAGAREVLTTVRQVIMAALGFSRIVLATTVLLFILILITGWLRPGLLANGIALLVAGIIAGVLALLLHAFIAAFANGLEGQEAEVILGLVDGPMAYILRWPLYVAGGYVLLGAALLTAYFVLRPKEGLNPGEGI